MSAYSEYFLNSNSNVVMLDCFELAHQYLTQTYYFVRNATNGVTVVHEDSTEHAYQYSPVRYSFERVRTDLDQIMKIEFGDVGLILPTELDNIRANDGFNGLLPTIKYRAYRSDDLDTVLDGPVLLEIRAFTFSRKGCNFEARAPSLNVSKTGERYTLGRFPMLRGLL